MKGINFPSKQQWALISVVLFSILVMRECVCNGNKQKGDVVQQPPPNINKQLIDTSKILSEFKKKQDDSFNKILKPLYAQNERNNGEFVNLVNQNEELAQINSSLQKQLDYPDTCKKVVSILTTSHNQYVAQTKQTIEQGQRSIYGLNQTIQSQKSFLSEKDKLYSRLKSNIDTCIANNAALEKYAKQVKPKRAITVNVQALSPYSIIKPVYGAGIGYVNKKGLEISATYWSNQQISISLRKPLIRF